MGLRARMKSARGGQSFAPAPQARRLIGSLPASVSPESSSMSCVVQLAVGGMCQAAIGLTSKWVSRVATAQKWLVPQASRRTVDVG